MPNKKSANKKKRPAARKSNKKKTYKAPRLWFSLFIVLLLLIAAMIIINHSRRDSDRVTLEEVRTDAVTTIEEDRSVSEAIEHSAELLGVPSNLISRRIDDGVFTYFIRIDRERIDLTLANMILSGSIENAGGTIVKGEDISRGSAQVLTVRNEAADRDYLIRISYARPGAYPSQKPKLAIIVDDFGEFSGDLLDEFLSTDINVTFAILPHLRHSEEVMNRAVESGREVILHIPMEPMGYPRNDPGANPILVEHSERQIIRRMEGYLRNLPLVSGANNHMGSLATTDRDVMKTVLEFLKERELYFIDSRTSSLSVAYDLAQSMLLPSAKRDMFLDMPDTSEETLRQKVEELEGMYRSNRNVIAITHCFDRQRLEMLNLFIEEAERIGYELVPVSVLFIRDVPEII